MPVKGPKRCKRPVEKHEQKRGNDRNHDRNGPAAGNIRSKGHVTVQEPFCQKEQNWYCNSYTKESTGCSENSAKTNQRHLKKERNKGEKRDYKPVSGRDVDLIRVESLKLGGDGRLFNDSSDSSNFGGSVLSSVFSGGGSGSSAAASAM